MANEENKVTHENLDELVKELKDKAEHNGKKLSYAEVGQVLEKIDLEVNEIQRKIQRILRSMNWKMS